MEFANFVQQRNTETTIADREKEPVTVEFLWVSTPSKMKDRGESENE